MRLFVCIIRVLGALALVLPFATLTLAGAHATEPCTVARMIEAHLAGLARYKSQDHEGALAYWQPLANIGFPPAQGQLAGLHAFGRGGLASDPKEAAKWLVLASQAGDGDSAEAVVKVRQSLGDAAFQEATAAARAWQPTLPPCLRFDYGRVERLDGRSVRIGPSTVRVDERFSDEVAASILGRFRLVIHEARRMSPAANLYLSSVKAYHIIPGDKYDRYVGWKVGARGHELEMTIGNVLDKSPTFLATAILQEVAREVYWHLPGARLNDSYQQIYKGKRIVGSIYPDINNKPFFDAVLGALAIAERLPQDIRRHVEIIDEIRYNPQSDHMMKGGTLDPGIGYYDRRLSAEGRRIIFIRRDMKWSFPADVLLTIVHEGTHATQHQRAERMVRELPAKQASLASLGKDGPAASAKGDALRREIAAMEEYLRLWSRRGGTEQERLESLKRIECEATVQEIKTAQALDYEPSVVTKSPYFQFCDDVQKMMVEWKDRRLREGLQKNKNSTAPVR